MNPLVSAIRAMLAVLGIRVAEDVTEVGTTEDSDHLGESSTSNTKTFGKSSSKLQEKSSFEVGHKMVSFAVRGKLVDHLLAVPSIADVARRAIVIDQLPPEIKTNVAHNSVDKIHVLNILNACLQYTNGIHELKSILLFFEKKSIPMQQFEQTLNHLLPIGLYFGQNDEQSLPRQGVLQKEVKLVHRDENTDVLKAFQRVQKELDQLRLESDNQYITKNSQVVNGNNNVTAGTNSTANGRGYK